VSSDADPAPGNQPSAAYRVCVFDARNRIFRSARFVEAVSDEKAIEIATQLFDGRTIQLWHGTRLVAHRAGSV
jgi:hypothetical protein